MESAQDIAGMYRLLDSEHRNFVDSYIRFVYYQQENAQSEETADVIQAALRGEDILGTFDTVEEMVQALNA